MSAENIKSSMGALTIGALGIVFGDIGTSPLYAFKQVFANGFGVNETVVYGSISMIFWSMVVLLCIKYSMFIMKNDNEGEGGSMALTALVVKNLPQKSFSRQIAVFIGIIATALFFGECAITPAISVLSAMEGLELVSPSFKPYIIPLSLVIICFLFFIQKKGTEKVGKLFGPAMIIWFSLLTILGMIQIFKYPGILQSLSPYWAFSYFKEYGFAGLSIIAVITLAITGCEALYADMGHFGRKPIVRCWFYFVMPALIINYMGQAALVMNSPDAVSNPFFSLAPEWALIPLVVVSAFATIIASQAVISGVFSICKQCITLGLLPRLRIEYTSNKEIGQIFIPSANFLLFLAVIAIVLGFKESDALGAAYGLSVTGTMTLTTLLAAASLRITVKWSWYKVSIFSIVFLSIDLLFLTANWGKLEDGGWLPIFIGLFFVFLMLTWKKGKDYLRARRKNDFLDVRELVKSLELDMPHRVKGASVFLHAIDGAVPPCFLHNLRHNQVIHENVLFLTVKVEKKPFVSESDRLRIVNLGNGFFKGIMYFGFREITDVPKALKKHAIHKGFPYPNGETSYFMNRENLIDSGKLGFFGLLSKTYVLMSRNSSNTSEYFKLPTNRVVELGERVEI